MLALRVTAFEMRSEPRILSSMKRARARYKPLLFRLLFVEEEQSCHLLLNNVLHVAVLSSDLSLSLLSVPTPKT